MEGEEDGKMNVDGFDAKQRKAYNMALSGYSFFLSGPGGTGKSFVVNAIVEGLRKKGKRVRVAASTNQAASHLDSG